MQGHVLAQGELVGYYKKEKTKACAAQWPDYKLL
jgi:hypothetical protein